MNIDQLRLKLNELEIKKDAYSLLSSPKDETYCLEYKFGQWSYFYSERGQRSGEKVFSNECEACIYFYDQITSDPTVK